ncbi:MAG: J domain-containing protein [Dehalococcoidia bacterium]
MAQNYYDILGINKDASDKDIKSAYRRMARKLHPDVNPNDERAQDQFKKVNEAYEVVGDSARRKDYDQFGDNWKHADQMRNMGGGPRGQGGASGGFGFNLSDLFGAASTGHASRSARSSTSFSDMFGSTGGAQQQQGPILHKGTLDVSLDEVYTGATRRISIGSGSSGQRNLEVQIPKGVPDGRKIKLRPDRNTEVTLTVKVRADKRFSREGANLRAEISVPLLDAMLGGEAEVPTMTGRIALNIPAGTQNGRSFKIKGRGLPRQNSDEHGDLFATVKVRLPENLSPEEQQIYSQLRDIRATVGSETPDFVTDSGSDPASGQYNEGDAS